MTGTGIIDEVKYTFRRGSMLTRLIYINLGVFLAVKIVDIISFLFAIPGGNFLMNWLSVPADLSVLLYKPWSLITYMFLHQSLLHILFNMLWLYWLGKIFLEYLTGKQLLNVYLLGGISGALLYILAYNIFPAFQYSLPVAIAFGASASVMAIVFAAATYVPNYTVYLMFLGPVKLKYIAIASVALDLILLMDGNAGGHIAHLGGAMFGYFYIKKLRQGKDITSGFGRVVDSVASWFKPKSHLKVTYKRSESDFEYNKRKKSEQQTVDKILEKIAKSGYDSLSKAEKELLFKQGRQY